MCVARAGLRPIPVLVVGAAFDGMNRLRLLGKRHLPGSCLQLEHLCEMDQLTTFES